MERAWLDRRDAGAVDRLASQHPEHAEELYAFFAALVAGGEVEDLPEELVREASEHLGTLFAEPGPFVAYLRARTGEEPETIVRRIGDVTWEFLTQVSRHPSLVPPGVREELASRIMAAWNVPRAECLERLAVSGPVPLAAARSRPFPPSPASFAELLRRSSLDREQRACWTAFARRSRD